jgi:hypothetical protein
MFHFGNHCFKQPLFFVKYCNTSALYCTPLLCYMKFEWNIRIGSQEERIRSQFVTYTMERLIMTFLHLQSRELTSNQITNIPFVLRSEWNGILRRLTGARDETLRNEWFYQM